MKEFIIHIDELLTREVRVQAESEQEAVSQVQEQYYNEDIILSADDYFNTDIWAEKGEDE